MKRLILTLSNKAVSFKKMEDKCMKYKFARRGEVTVNEFNEIVKNLFDSVERIETGDFKQEDVIEYVKGIIGTSKSCKGMPEGLFWGYAEPDEMPSDARVDLFYMPTYYNVAFMMKAFMVMPEKLLSIDNFLETISRGLTGCTGRAFLGHGYEGVEVFCRVMKLFLQARVDEFVNVFPEISSAFTNQINSAFDHIRETVEKQTIESQNDTEIVVFRELFERIVSKDFNYVFVYGTLMKGQSNHDVFMKEAQFVSNAALLNYELYNLGSYPGVKYKDDTRVKGELYRVSNDILEDLDCLEGKDSLFLYEDVVVELNERVRAHAHVYSYIPEVNDALVIAYDLQPWNVDN